MLGTRRLTPCLTRGRDIMGFAVSGRKTGGRRISHTNSVKRNGIELITERKESSIHLRNVDLYSGLVIGRWHPTRCSLRVRQLRISGWCAHRIEKWFPPSASCAQAYRARRQGPPISRDEGSKTIEKVALRFSRRLPLPQRKKPSVRTGFLRFGRFYFFHCHSGLGISTRTRRYTACAPPTCTALCMR
jgi:hypothetical protein